MEEIKKIIINESFNVDLFDFHSFGKKYIEYKNNETIISNLIFKGDVNLGFSDKDIRFKLINCIFEGKINFDLKGSIDFDKCIFKKEIHLSYYIKKLSSLNYYKCKFSKGLYLEYFSVGLLSFYENKGDININSLTIGDFFIIPIGKYSINISLLEISKNFSIGGTSNGFLSRLELNDIKFLSDENVSIIFQNIIIGKLILNNFLNYSKNLNFQNLLLKKLNIKNTDLGRTTFNGVQIEKLYLENATLNDCIFNGVEFLDDYRLVDIKDEKGNIEYGKMKDNYRQLKFVMDKNGNYTEGNKFFSREMESYNFSLKWSLKTFNRKFILFIQNHISLFGNSWIIPILLIIALVIITTLITYLYVENIDFIRSFLFFLYPLYGLKKDFFEGFDNWMLLGSMSYKLIYGILLWHLVIALKRTTKR